MTGGGCRQVMHVEIREKSEKRIRDVWMDIRDKTRNCVDLVGIDIAGDKQCAGDEQGRVWTIAHAFRNDGEVFQRSHIGCAGEGEVEVIVVGFKVEFDTSSRLDRQVNCLAQQPGMHAAIRLPTHQDILTGQPPAGSESMGHLTGGIPAEETNTKSSLVGAIRQSLRAQGNRAPENIVARIGYFEMPVLAEKTVKGA